MTISAILNATGIYSQTDIQLFERNIKFRSILKDEILLAPGEVCTSFYYNMDGAFYQYNYKNEIEENILDLHADDEWFLNHASFVSQKPAGSFIKAYAQSEIFELEIGVLHQLIAQSPAFLQLLKVLGEASSRVHFFDNRLTPTQKYEYVLANKREWIQKFPLKLIASYLKITPETLSRVRENFATER